MARFTLLNTRPLHQAKSLNDLVKAAKGAVLSCPTLAIMPQAPPLDRSPLSTFDVVVFISVNAVNEFVKLGLALPKNKQACSNWFAIGRATYQAANLAQLPMTALETDQFDSEHLLTHPKLQNLIHKNVLIVKGEQGRDLLASTFKQRGATVEAWPLYTRQVQPLCTASLSELKHAQTPIVLATSVASLDSLINSLPIGSTPNHLACKCEQACLKSNFSDQADDELWLMQQRLVVFSHRIKAWANDHGWKGPIYVVSSMSDHGIIECIEHQLGSHIHL